MALFGHFSGHWLTTKSPEPVAEGSGASWQAAGNTSLSQCPTEGRDSWLQPQLRSCPGERITATCRPWRAQTLLSATPPTPANSTSSHSSLKEFASYIWSALAVLYEWAQLISSQHREDQAFISLQLPFRHIQHVSAFIFGLHCTKINEEFQISKVTWYDSNIFNTSRLPGGIWTWKETDFLENRLLTSQCCDTGYC